MSERDKNRTTFRKPHCCECGVPLDPEAATYKSKLRLYCAECAPLGEVKDQWKPMLGRSVSAVFVIKSSNK